MNNNSKIYKWVIVIACICFAAIQFICFGFGVSLDISLFIDVVSFFIAVGVVMFSNKKIADLNQIKESVEDDINETMQSVQSQNKVIKNEENNDNN